MDRLSTTVLRLVRRFHEANPAHSWGVVQAYNPATHMCKVTLDPAGDTEWLPISVPFMGLAHPIPQGTPCRVDYEQGVPTAISGLFYGPGPVPNAGLSLQGDAHIGGNLTVYGAFTLTPGRTSGHPTTGAHNQGELWMDSAGALWACTASGSPGTWKQATLT